MSETLWGVIIGGLLTIVPTWYFFYRERKDKLKFMAFEKRLETYSKANSQMYNTWISILPYNTIYFFNSDCSSIFSIYNSRFSQN